MNKIFKQASWLIIGQFLTKVISFFYTIFLAKSLGVEEFGLYIVAISYFSIISAFADFGFNRYLIREISIEKTNTNQLLWNTLILRLALASILFATFTTFLYSFDENQARVSLVLIALMAVLPQSIAMTFDAILISLKKLQLSAIMLFISTAVMSFFGWFLVSQNLGSIGAIAGLIFGQLIYALGFFLIVFLNIGIHIPKIHINIIKQVIKDSLPYGVLGILGLLYFRIDSIILSYLRGSYEVGIYGASYRFLETIIFIPASFAVALFPNMAKLYSENLLDLKKLYFKSLKLMLILGLIFLLAYFFILPILIKFYLPNYLPSIEVIKILALSIPFIFIATPGVQVLLSTDKYLKPVIYFSIFTLLLNIILNLLFIPKYGYIAAAWVTVLSDIVSFIIFFILINKYIFSASSKAGKKN